MATDPAREVERLAASIERDCYDRSGQCECSLHRAAALLRGLWAEHEAVGRMLANDGTERWDATEHLAGRDSAVSARARVEALIGGEE